MQFNINITNDTGSKWPSGTLSIASMPKDIEYGRSTEVRKHAFIRQVFVFHLAHDEVTLPGPDLQTPVSPGNEKKSAPC